MYLAASAANIAETGAAIVAKAPGTGLEWVWKGSGYGRWLGMRTVGLGGSPAGPGRLR